MSTISLTSIVLSSRQKKYNFLFSLFFSFFFFFMLSTVKSFEIFFRYNELIDFTPLAYKKLLVALYCRIKAIFFLDLVILIGYSASAFIVESSDPFVGPSPKVTFFFYSRLMKHCLHQK